MYKLAGLAALLLAPLFLGCGDDEPAPEPPPPPNKPKILSAEALCRQVGVERQWVLEELNLSVRDMDGVGDIQEPEVIVLANRMSLESESVPWANEDCNAWCEDYCPESCEAGDEACLTECADTCASETCPAACGEDACEARYTWARTPDSEQILCGESSDALLLEVEITVRDAEGFRAEAWVVTQEQP